MAPKLGGSGFKPKVIFGVLPDNSGQKPHYREEGAIVGQSREIPKRGNGN